MWGKYRASIDTETVAKALVSIFSRVGIPNEVLTDIGTQYTPALMKEVSRLLSFKQLVTTPYHPICNGLVERFNQTIKKMLMRMCAERPKDWDKYIDPLLFAYREAPQESLGFSPFEFLYCWPVSILPRQGLEMMNHHYQPLPEIYQFSLFEY